MPTTELDVELVGVEIENLRGFRHARLDLREGLLLLVGPNNSGKTSLLRLLDWLINHASEDVLVGDRAPSVDEVQFLMPARDTHRNARRLTFLLRIPDGRRRRRFSCKSDIAKLRIGVSRDLLRMNVGPPRLKERDDLDNQRAALALLRALRGSVIFVLVPASRDASSASFLQAYRDAVGSRLKERAMHAKQAGAPIGYRQVKRMTEEIRKTAEQLISPLWSEIEQSLPPGLVKTGRFQLELEPQDLVDWMTSQISLRIVTGEHDVDSVEPAEVGSGLQSHLQLAIALTSLRGMEQNHIIAIEEPEAYLHPAAQRSFARKIVEDIPGTRIVSTHSPLLVDEARYGEVVLVRDHHFYMPKPLEQSDPRRESINSVLISGHGAEMAFSRSVLLVEGPGDRLYLEALRRRVADETRDGRLDELAVVPVGGKDQFAPWLRLLQSYGDEGDRPIAWLVVADGDATTEVIRAWRNAGLVVPVAVNSDLHKLKESHTDDLPIKAKANSARQVNKIAQQHDVNFHFHPIDLEYVILSNCSPATVVQLAKSISAPVNQQQDLERWLRKNKQPWMRGVLARETPWSEVARDTKQTLERWMSGVMRSDEAKAHIRKVV